MSTNKLTDRLTDEPLSQTLFGATFQNPVLLAAGTCGFGEEIEDALDLDALGGIVTKSVTLEPRAGNPAPRVLEAGNAMLNSVGLANPGLERVCAEKLPWMTEHLSGIQVFVSVAGHIPDEYWRIIEGLESVGGFLGYELNLSCPNDTRLGGLPFALDSEALCGVVEGARKLTDRPLLVKLAPNVPDIGPIAKAAEDAGADGLTLVNTMPGLVIDIASGARPSARAQAVCPGLRYGLWACTPYIGPGHARPLPSLGSAESPQPRTRFSICWLAHPLSRSVPPPSLIRGPRRRW